MPLLNRLDVQVFARAGHSNAKTEELTGLPERAVRRIRGEADVAHDPELLVGHLIEIEHAGLIERLCQGGRGQWTLPKPPRANTTGFEEAPGRGNRPAVHRRRARRRRRPSPRQITVASREAPAVVNSIKAAGSNTAAVDQALKTGANQGPEGRRQQAGDGCRLAVDGYFLGDAWCTGEAVPRRASLSSGQSAPTPLSRLTAPRINAVDLEMVSSRPWASRFAASTAGN